MDQQYQYNNPGTVTYVDELPDIDMLDGMNHSGMGSTMGNGYHGHYPGSHSMYDKAYGRPISQPSQQQLQSKLRQPHMALPESGMNMMRPVHPVSQNVVNTPAHMPSHAPSHYEQQPQQQQQPPQEHYAEYYEQLSNSNSSHLSCLEISEHIKNCPICSKFYNNDNTVYIIVIVILSIICILLLKRVLDI
mgnify:CR=1 FL=1